MESVHELDVEARGCGEVTPLVRQALRDIAPGDVLAVRTREAPVGTELVAWCRLTGHEFLRTESGAGANDWVHLIRRKQN
jgi:TusA-related sulfurtransferase